jgi:hypothetical protein
VTSLPMRIPAASWWARTVVESTLTRDKSVSDRQAASAITPSDSAVNKPVSLHTRKRRVDRLGHGPNSPGISRHWLLVRNRQITPSNCPRSRSGYGPHSPIGRQGSMNSPCCR